MNVPTSIILFSTLLFVLITHAGGDDTVVVDPMKFDGPPAALIIFPEVLVGSNDYIQLGESIQERSPYKLWIVTVGGWMYNIINPWEMNSNYEHALSLLKSHGFPDGASLFLGGHGFGGAVADNLTRTQPHGIAGVVLFASYVTGMDDINDYPTPILVISGNQDGICRLTRIAQQLPESGNFSARNPVLLVEGVNHGHMASGTLPDIIAKYDLLADSSVEEAHDIVGKYVTDFMVVNGNGTNSTQIKASTESLWDLHNTTYETVKFFQGGLHLDHGNDSTWAIWLQMAVGGISSGYIDIYPQEVRETDLLTVQPNITKEVGVITIVDVTVPYYTDAPINPFDLPIIQQTPYQMSVVAASKNQLEKFMPAEDFFEDQGSCWESNYLTILFAHVTVPIDYTMRYMLKGRKLVFLPDIVIKDKLEWLSRDIEWREGRLATEVASPIYRDPNNNVTMCKIVTYSRVMEYILIDAFRK